MPDLGLSDPADLPLLQRPEQVLLKGGARLADLIKKKGSPIGDLEESGRIVHGARESALLVAEELALQERLGQGGAVDRYEGFVLPRAVGVNRPGDQFLPRSRLALQQDSDGRRDRALHQ